MVLKDTIIAKLWEIQSLERREHSVVNFPTSMEMIGIKVPEMRLMMKSILPEIKNLDYDSQINLALELIGTGIFEAQQFAFLMIGEDKKMMNILTREDALKFKVNLDNWCSVDTYCCYISSVLWRQGKFSDDEIRSWAFAENFWERRCAVVSTVPLNTKARGGKGDTVRTIDICSLLVSDKHQMVQKAISWALRSLIAFDRKAVETFMLNYDNVISSRVRKEVNSKLTTGLKNGTKK